MRFATALPSPVARRHLPEAVERRRVPALSRRSLLAGLAGGLGVASASSRVRASGPSPEWTRRFAGGGFDSVDGIVTDGRGITVVGTSDDVGGWIRRYDHDGGRAWTRTALAGRPRTLVRTPDAGFLVGSSVEAGLRVTRLDPDGTVDRRTTHEELPGRPTALVVRPAGGHALVSVERAPDSTRVHVAVGDAAGTESWRRELTAAGRATSLLVADDGGLLVPVDRPQRSGELRRLDADGSLRAVRRYTLPGAWGPTALRTETGGVLLAGVDPEHAGVPWVVELDAALDERWRRRYDAVTGLDGPTAGTGVRLAATPSGYLVAGTEVDDAGDGVDLVPTLVRLGADGRRRSVERYPREASHRLLAVAVLDDHRTVIGGPTTTHEQARFDPETTDAVLAVVDDRTETTRTPPPTTWAETPTTDPPTTSAPPTTSEGPTPPETTATTTPGFGLPSALGALGAAGVARVLWRGEE